MEQVLVMAMWGAMWIAVGMVVFKCFVRSYQCLFLYSRCLGIAGAIDITTEKGKSFQSHVSRFIDGAKQTYVSHGSLSNVIIPATSVALILWLGLVVEYLFSLDFGKGYVVICGSLVIFAIFRTRQFFMSTIAHENAVWGLEVFRALKYEERNQLNALMAEAEKFDYGTLEQTDPMVHKMNQLILAEATKGLSATLANVEKEIKIMSTEIGTIKRLMKDK